MRDLIEKLKSLKNDILKEDKGLLFFLGLISRIDAEKKWDLVLVADWVKTNNSKEDIEYILRKLSTLEINWGLIENIVVFRPDFEFVFELKSATEDVPVRLYEKNRIDLEDDTFIDCIPLYIDFEDFDYERQKQRTEELITSEF